MISPLVALCIYHMFDESKLFQDPAPIVQSVFRVPQDLESNVVVPHLDYLVCPLSSFWSTLVATVSLSLTALYRPDAVTFEGGGDRESF